MLDADAVVHHLRSRGIIPQAGAVSVTALGGGVSGAVWSVLTADRGLVVKQALPRLRVTHTWLADPRRTVTEGRALRLAAAIDAAWVPRVIDLDEELNVLVLDQASPGVTTWKELLIGGVVDTDIAARLGSFIARLHGATRLSAGVTPPGLLPFEQDEAFAQLRVQPYFETVAARQPVLGALIMAAVMEMRTRRRCLVHGDVSPKNVLWGTDLLWLIDWEVAHLGDPAFDIAFLCTHLLLKSVHMPAAADRLRAAALAFLATYAAADGVADDDRHLCALVGALLIARVDGASPVEYLDTGGREQARSLGAELAAHPAPSLTEAIEAIQSGVGG